MYIYIQHIYIYNIYIYIYLAIMQEHIYKSKRNITTSIHYRLSILLSPRYIYYSIHINNSSNHFIYV